MTEPTGSAGTTDQAGSAPAGQKPTQTSGSAPAPSPGTTYSKKAENVTAIQYTAPDGDTEAGNVDDVKEFSDSRATEQTPWNPGEGQNCLVLYGADDAIQMNPEAQQLEHTTQPLLIEPGDWLIKDADGSFAVEHDEDFAESYAASK